MKAEDESLVRACRKGNRGAFESLFDRYERPIFNLALRMVHDRDEASDITQTTFAKAWERLGSFDFRHRFYSWLYRIAVNECLDQLARRRPTAALDEGAASELPDPEQAAGEHERSAIVRHALLEISPDHRAVLILKHYLDLSYSEIGTVLDLPERTVRSRLYEARQNLRRCLSRARNGK